MLLHFSTLHKINDAGEKEAKTQSARGYSAIQAGHSLIKEKTEKNCEKQ